jgi:hypothetical protein
MQRQRESQLAERTEQVRKMHGFQVDRLSLYCFRATMITRGIGVGESAFIGSSEERYEYHGSIPFTSCATVANV